MRPLRHRGKMPPRGHQTSRCIAQPKPATPSTSERSAPPENYWRDIDRLADEAAANQANPAEAAWQDAELRGKVDSLTGALQHFMAERQLERDKTDFQKIVDKANADYLADVSHVPNGFAKRWLESETINDERLRDAFDHRHDNPQTRHHAERVFKKALERMQREARSAPDPNLTADVAAVTAAVRGASRV